MTTSDVSQILADLQGTALESQCMALERFFAFPATSVSDADKQSVLMASVMAMETSSNPYPIAERLLRFGEAAIAPVSDLYARTPPSEVKIFAALILLHKGSRLGVPELVAEVERGGELLFMASLALANAQITDHVPAIIERLRRFSIIRDREFPSNEDDGAITLLHVLRKLRVPLPEDIRRKFSDPSAPQFFHWAVEQKEGFWKTLWSRLFRN